MTEFRFSPSQWVPFRDKEVIERCRAIKREDIEKHSNPNYKIKVYKDEDVGFNWVLDMFSRIKRAAESGRKIVMIMPNPNPKYVYVAKLINEFGIDCKHVYGFAMDEYADENGNIAPVSWKFGFGYAMYKYFWEQIDEHLRPPIQQIVAFTNDNFNDYGKMITDLGGADVCYSGPGWTGHLAFIDPDSPEFKADSLEQWKKMGPRIVTLSPFTLAQNSLHGLFGKSGDLSAVPPRAATIGPAQVVEAKERVQAIAITVHNTSTAWQRMIGRLVMHGPVTPLVPESLLQELGAKVIVSESIAADIEPDWNKGY
jgi:glucosamine-6-phosphate deaminase